MTKVSIHLKIPGDEQRIACNGDLTARPLIMTTKCDQVTCPTCREVANFKNIFEHELEEHGDKDEAMKKAMQQLMFDIFRRAMIDHLSNVFDIPREMLDIEGKESMHWPDGLEQLG